MHTDAEVHKEKHKVVLKELLDSGGQGYNLSNIWSFSTEYSGKKKHRDLLKNNEVKSAYAE